jgi:hypothetical protein
MEEEQNKAPEKQEGPQFDWELFGYFIKIIRTIFVGLFWMMVNVFVGIYLGLGIPSESTPLRLFFFYTWFLITLAAYIYWIWKMWNKKMKAP